MKKQKHLIIGAGEVGMAIYEVLKGKYEVDPVRSSNTPRDFLNASKGEADYRLRLSSINNLAETSNRVDIQDAALIHNGHYDVLHICYPPVKNFVQTAKNYIKIYKPHLVIIHSTVPVGTTKKIAPFAVHSPIRGVHPHLAEGIKTFVKYFGGKKAKEAAKIFSALGVTVKAFPKSETSELLKILDTTYYGWNIIFAKEAKRICDKLNLDFDEVYTDANISYNEGYKKLDKSNVMRPVLTPMPGKIGGHCIVSNCGLLEDWLTKTVKDRNKKY